MSCNFMQHNLYRVSPLYRVKAHDVGHFGLFNGSKFRKIILPEIKAYTSVYNFKTTKKVLVRKNLKKKDKR